MSDNSNSIDSKDPSDILASSHHDTNGKIGFVSLGCPKNTKYIPE